MEYTLFIGTFVGVCAKVVTLSLDQVSRQHGRTIAVIVGYRCAEGRYWNTVLYGIGYYITQGLLVVIGDLLEVRCQ